MARQKTKVDAALTASELKERELLAAQGKVLPERLDPLIIVPVGAYNGGVNHGPAVQVSEVVAPTVVDDKVVDDPASLTDLDLVVDVVGAYGGEPTMILRIKSSPNGSENSFAEVAHAVITTEGQTALHAPGVGTFVRAEFEIGGVSPMFEFSVVEGTLDIDEDIDAAATIVPADGQNPPVPPAA